MKKILLFLIITIIVTNYVLASGGIPLLGQVYSDGLRSLRIERLLIKSNVKRGNDLGFNVTAVVVTSGLKNKNLEMTITYRYPNGQGVELPNGVLKGEVDKNGFLRKKGFLKVSVDNKSINYSFFYPYSFFKHSSRSEYIVTIKLEYDVFLAKSELQFKYDYRNGVIPTRTIAGW